ncbi:uncharacterized protein LOC144115859 isoform X2 [Amblyomma americanum]
MVALSQAQHRPATIRVPPPRINLPKLPPPPRTRIDVQGSGSGSQHSVSGSIQHTGPHAAPPAAPLRGQPRPGTGRSGCPDSYWKALTDRQQHPHHPHLCTIYRVNHANNNNNNMTHESCASKVHVRPFEAEPGNFRLLAFGRMLPRAEANDRR